SIRTRVIANKRQVFDPSGCSLLYHSKVKVQILRALKIVPKTSRCHEYSSPNDSKALDIVRRDSQFGAECPLENWLISFAVVRYLVFVGVKNVDASVPYNGLSDVQECV